MLSIILCEDNPLLSEYYAEQIRHILISEELEARIYQTYTSSQVLINELFKIPTPALYFLDVNYPGEPDGLKLAQHIRRHDARGFIVFITGHENYAEQVFQYHLEALDYICKTDTGIHSRIHNCILNAYNRYCAHSGSAPAVSIKTDLQEHTILIRDIYYVSTGEKPHYLQIGTVNGIYETRGNLSDFHKRLGNDFWQCHKSYIIAQRYVKFIDMSSKNVHLRNGDICPISRNYYSKYIKSKGD